ncbi:transmembrane reductase CYB561D2-like [Zophobas morio]|uniref:transmembrane reductase CYB561D2-like n=1 Tax=Zophobas morio TaxID=2755281 RepID=UPI0030828C24
MSEAGSFRTNVVRFVTNLVVRYMLASVVVYSCWIAIANYNYWFSWHVILCTFGMIPLMTEALMLFAPDELWTRQLTRTQKYWIHGFLMTLGTVLVSAGCIDTFYYISDGYHLYTVHGITGLISMILFMLSIVLGFLANYSQRLTKYGRPVTFKFNHNIIGLLGFVIGIVSLCYAYYTRWFVYFTSEESRIVALIVTIIGSLWTMNASLVSAYNQIKTLLGR